MKLPMSIDDLRSRAAKLPRVKLTELPTPLQACPRLSEAVGHGVRLLVKRDDLTGLGCGGNKLRKLEFSLGEAKAAGCDVLIHGLAGQSNYCRQAAAAAASWSSAATTRPRTPRSPTGCSITSSAPRSAWSARPPNRKPPRMP